MGADVGACVDSRCSKSSRDIIKCAVLSRRGVLSLSSTCPAALVCTAKHRTEFLAKGMAGLALARAWTDHFVCVGTTSNIASVASATSARHGAMLNPELDSAISEHSAGSDNLRVAEWMRRN